MEIHFGLELATMHFLPHNLAYVKTFDTKYDCMQQCLYYVHCLSVVYSIPSGRCYIYETPIPSEQGTEDLNLLMYKATGQRGNCSGFPPFLNQLDWKRVLPLYDGYEYDYESTIDMCYKINTANLLTSHDADQTCKDEGALGLARLDSQEKVNFFKDRVTEKVHIDGILAGGGQWVYPGEMNPTSTPVIDWSPTQPNGNGQYCLGVESAGIFDVGCTGALFGYICEHDLNV